MGSSGGVVDEERLVGRHRVLQMDVLDGVVGEVVVEVIVRVADVRLDGRVAVEDKRAPLVHVTADEAVELLKAEAGGPAVEGTCLAGLPVGNVMVFAEPGGVVAVLAKELADACCVFAYERIVPGIAGGHLHNLAGVYGVMIPPSQQRSASRRAHRCRVKAVVEQTALGQGVERRGVDGTAEGLRCGEAYVVKQNKENVRRALRCGGHRRKSGLGVLRALGDLTLEWWNWFWKNFLSENRKGDESGGE
jgi:hypothetical protein